jgi:hypothetical protein
MSAANLFYNPDGISFDPESVGYMEYTLREVVPLVRSDAVVLDLCGRFGVVACRVNGRLAEPARHVVVEAGSRNWASLWRNRDSHGCAFAVVEGAVSKQPLRFQIGDEMTVSCPDGAPDALPNTSYLAALRMLPAGSPVFDTVFADMEGSFELFLRDYPQRAKDWRFVYADFDRADRCNYEWVTNVLQAAGLCITRRDGCQRIFERLEDDL